jgi:hypothetical protein
LKNIALKQLLPPLVLFHKNKRLISANYEPSYTIEKLSPYLNIENYLGENEAEDPYYFGYAFIQQIKK